MNPNLPNLAEAPDNSAITVARLAEVSASVSIVESINYYVPEGGRQFGRLSGAFRGGTLCGVASRDPSLPARERLPFDGDNPLPTVPHPGSAKCTHRARNSIELSRQRRRPGE